MKEFKVCMIATAIACAMLIGFALVMPACAESENVERFPALVVGYELEQDIVTVVDELGDSWEFYGVEDWKIGDLAWITVYTFGTIAREDDEIVDVEYAGTLTIKAMTWWLTR